MKRVTFGFIVATCLVGCALSGGTLNLFEPPRVAVLTRPAPAVTDEEWQRGCFVKSQDEAKHMFVVRCPADFTETRYCIAREPIDVVSRKFKKGWLESCKVQ